MHGREWITSAVVMYIMRQLVENYEKHRSVVDKADWYLMPVVNPDGYEYSHSTDRLWRKTRSNYELSENDFAGNYFRIYKGQLIAWRHNCFRCLNNAMRQKYLQKSGANLKNFLHRKIFLRNLRRSRFEPQFWFPLGGNRSIGGSVQRPICRSETVFGAWNQSHGRFHNGQKRPDTYVFNFTVLLSNVACSLELHEEKGKVYLLLCLILAQILRKSYGFNPLFR